MNEFWHGDAESRTQWGTYSLMDLLLGLVADKVAGKIGKVTSLGESVNLARFPENIPPILSQLPLKDRFAFADTNGLNLKSFNNSIINDAKDTFLFFDKFKSYPNSIYKNNGSVEHIFHGNINGKGKAGGYHHVSMMGEGEIIQITKQPNKHGVYQAKVQVNGVVKQSESTFFPDTWDRIQVLKCINEAYQNAQFVKGTKNTYIGKSMNGMQIQMFLDKSTGRIISAFPIY
ncbi:EndoU domain-containing protein [Bacillus mycoides]|uniref:EndoU domain-containing protein n=1 Tax=Bacillus mycoides TaxID=1405 RepID=UPI003D0183A2